MSFYLAKFSIENDRNWSYNDFNKLSGKKYLFDEPEDALEVIREHLRECINSIISPFENIAAIVFNDLKNLYDDDSIWVLPPEADENGNILYVYYDGFNYTVKYSIDEVDFYESEEVLAIDFDDSDYDNEYEEDDEEGEEEIE